MAFVFFVIFVNFVPPPSAVSVFVGSPQVEFS